MSESKAEWKARLGIGTAQSKFHTVAGTSRTTEVIGDDGALAGRTVGAQVDHWDDRRDAKVSAMTTYVNRAALRLRKGER